jgi:dTDP-N-acetylfucosamine:lipid II N-acetylfucosaminyltransferase
MVDKEYNMGNIGCVSCGMVVKLIRKLEKTIRSRSLYTWYINRKLKHAEIIHLMFNDKFNAPMADLFNNNFDTTKQVILCKRWFSEHPFPSGKNVFCVTSFRNINLAYCDKIIAHSLFDQEVVDIMYDNPQLLQKSHWAIWGGDLYNPPRNKKHDFVRSNFNSYSSIMYVDREYAIEKYAMKGRFYDAPNISDMSTDKLDKLDTRKEQETIKVQINNSADRSTLDMLDSLARFRDMGIKVTTVLSYGDMDIKESIIQKGKELFGSKFEYLDRFLTPNDYLKHLAQIDVLVLNQNRQQGLWNVIAAIYLEKKVFIKSDISSYNCLNNLGINVFNSDDVVEMDIGEFLQNDSKVMSKKSASKYISVAYAITAWREVFSG